MKTVRVIVEGPTEEGFVNRVLNPHFRSFHLNLEPHISKNFTVPNLNKFERIARLYLDRADVAAVTMMFDLYELSSQYTGLVERYDELTGQEKAVGIERALGERINHAKFVPNILLHEFETLLFSEPSMIGEYFGTQVDRLQEIVSQLQPEDINHGIETAPSKRISQVVREYEDEKPFAGPTIAERIGLAKMREKCPHFHNWISRLEELGD